MLPLYTLNCDLTFFWCHYFARVYRVSCQPKFALEVCLCVFVCVLLSFLFCFCLHSCILVCRLCKLCIAVWEVHIYYYYTHSDLRIVTTSLGLNFPRIKNLYSQDYILNPAFYIIKMRPIRMIHQLKRLVQDLYYEHMFQNSLTYSIFSKILL